MLERLREIWMYRDMLRSLVSKELRARYKGSILGFFWTFFNPLLMLIIYSLVFSFIMRSAVEKYPMFLFVALLPWNYFANSLVQGAGSLVHNASLIKKVYFPREVLPLSVVLANLLNYLLSLLILIPALLLFKIRPTVALFAFPFVLLTETLLVIALVLIISVADVYFRDLEHITGVFVTAWFFLTPVIYSVDVIPPKVRSVFFLNPMAHIVESYRKIFYHGVWPDWSSLGYVFLGCLGFCLLSFALFGQMQRAVAEEI